MCVLLHLFQTLKRSDQGSVCHAQDFLIRLRIMKGLKQPFTILDSVSGVLRPVSPVLPSPAHSCQHQLHIVLPPPLAAHNDEWLQVWRHEA